MTHFIDQVFIEVRSGDGGNGIVAWRREKYEPMGGPAGGSGGRGGHVFLQATKDLNTLIDFRFKRKFQATSGARGRPKGQHGSNADDLIIKVPVGTLVKDSEDGSTVADLVKDGQKVLVAEGGKGGLGNSMLASPTRRAPHFCYPGQPGVLRHLELELKLLADVGIVGLPNAGKSTLLSVMSAAKPKIADYPFSTLEPNLGVVKEDEGRAYVMADIPGLIEGASEGVGLGHAFLRHIERTRLLVHLVDATSETLPKDIETIDNELKLHSEKLTELPQFIVLNKADAVLDEELRDKERELKKRFKNREILTISAATGKGLDRLRHATGKTLKELTPVAVDDYLDGADRAQEDGADTYIVDPRASQRIDEGFLVVRKKGMFTVHGDKVARLVDVTNMRDPESLHHFYDVLKSMGVLDELIAQGARQGSEIHIAGITFTFGADVL